MGTRPPRQLESRPFLRDKIHRAKSPVYARLCTLMRLRAFENAFEIGEEEEKCVVLDV